MRIVLILPALMVLTACLTAREPEPEMPNVETEIANAITRESGDPVPETRKPVLFAFLRSKPEPAPQTTADIKIVTAEKNEQSELETPGLAVSFSRRLPSVPTGSGETLNFGTISVACGVSKRDLGKQVDKFPRNGVTKWRIYDTDPGSMTLRTQYITGFLDGCARQFTAALALFGSPQLHEIHRYGAAQKNIPYSMADIAYERVKSGICGVGRGKACPPSRSRPLQRGTSFVSVYQRFGGSAPWLEILLHNGKLLASETRSR